MLSRITPKSIPILRTLSHSPHTFCTLTESQSQTQTQKLERIADEILSLTKLERNDYAILMRYKMGFNNYGPSVAGLGSVGGAGGGGSGAAAETKAAEKVIFDVKLEKYDAATKIKIIKEVRGFTDLGLKEAKDLVEKVPIVVKKGITKDEAEAIMAKLKDLGATVSLE
ncbi:putative ribosomal protein L7/L12 [Helianthus annuus]|uniref:Large ribosomal subunit protein bL12c n=1 Tax=Helianthus annuus TaxID=4232 RepID=A0A251SLP3_HELAN|nr:50S ribosomal protein L7/L12 [Helianthus annuus]KAF5769627.1 putative mitochondrial carrier domain protein [Helianthus annuus]KAJ0464606.1 putative ribosomal protein L7/L12 [Helianthus annuus]KAJ0469223.1 putative ribosomal protein L7/L12 [Helianthus annuus]KAJ0486204.1 putative ribosomal protein L7/L12 [Helianthus annuus]KAJ0656753.1 putative ribosomal protein L7/L12 [Helianthus annuus]